MILTPTELLSAGRLVRVKTSDTFEVLDYDYDSAEQVMSFLVPSRSRPNERIYLVQVDAVTAEVACPCEALTDYRETRKNPYRRNAAGTMAEHMARAKGKYLGPMITRQPRFLCEHTRKARAWLSRHDLMSLMHQREADLIARLEGFEDKRKTA